MKTVQTNRVHSFEQWRVDNISKYGNFIWPQLNYTTPECNILKVIFEEKNNINMNIDRFIDNYINGNFEYKIINVVDKSSRYYIETSSIKDELNLILSNVYHGAVSSYWDYRIKTRPTNCITADIDSIELKGNYPIGIEAAQLYDTQNILESIKHIYRTFALRKNKVNPYQYIIQNKFMSEINGKSLIMFHEIQSGKLDEIKPVLIIENNNEFSNILKEIYENISESMFLGKYQDYFRQHLKSYENINEGYKAILKS